MDIKTSLEEIYGAEVAQLKGTALNVIVIAYVTESEARQNILSANRLSSFILYLERLND